MGHTLTNNRNGLVVNAMVTQANGHAEREAAKVMINDARQAHNCESTLTLGADKGYDAKEFIEALQEINVLPHVAKTNLVVNQPYPMQWLPARVTRSLRKSASA